MYIVLQYKTTSYTCFASKRNINNTVLIKKRFGPQISSRGKEQTVFSRMRIETVDGVHYGLSEHRRNIAGFQE